jgi:hypothetical protein
MLKQMVNVVLAVFEKVTNVLPATNNLLALRSQHYRELFLTIELSCLLQ